MITMQSIQNFQKAIDELDAAMSKSSRPTPQSENRFDKAFNETAKELRKSAGEVILKKAIRLRSGMI